MKNSLVLASNNPEKYRVANGVWRPECDIFTPANLGITFPEDIEKEESYSANARIKAEWLVSRVDLPVIADDSGMEIAGLKGLPGVSTRRWANGANDERLISKTVKSIEGLSEKGRACSFVISAVLINIHERVSVQVKAQDDGILLLEPRGEILPGHPLASLLYLPEYGKTLAELRDTPEFKPKDVRAHMRLKEIFLNLNLWP